MQLPFASSICKQNPFVLSTYGCRERTTMNKAVVGMVGIGGARLAFSILLLVEQSKNDERFVF